MLDQMWKKDNVQMMRLARVVREERGGAVQVGCGGRPLGSWKATILLVGQHSQYECWLGSGMTLIPKHKKSSWSTRTHR